MTESRTLLRRYTTVVFLALLTLFGTAAAQKPDCGGYDDTIVFAGLDWDSALVNNWIARTILEEGFGCQTDAIPGSNIPMLQGLIRGDIQVDMEVWQDNIPDFWQDALDSGRVVELGMNFDDAIQGWYVPRYLIEGDGEHEPLAPDLHSVEDLEKYAHLFRDPEQPDKGRFYNCIIGWQCELINTAKLHAYGLADDYTDFLPGTGAALATSMESAYLRGEPWFGYYWAPTWILGKLDMVRLEEPPYTDACWEEINAHLEDPEGLEQACAYPPSEVIIAANARFAKQASPEMLQFLKDYQTSSALLNKLLAYMQEQEASPQETAVHFLKTQPDVWTAWLPEAAAKRVQASLQ